MVARGRGGNQLLDDQVHFSIPPFYACSSIDLPCPCFFSNAHVQTVYHSEFRRVEGVQYSRERIETPDQDFLDLDWVQNGSDRIALVVHGLESSSSRAYIRGMVKALVCRKMDAVVMNLRGCSGEMNRQPCFYTAGNTADVETVLQHIKNRGYRRIVLVGFSLGGNLVLKYVGERAESIDPVIERAAAVSAPCDLRSSSVAIESPKNRIYNRRFVRKLLRKVHQKARLMPVAMSAYRFDEVTTLRQFDDLCTAPMAGYQNAEDYYEHASSRPYLSRIAIPTLLLNAQDDPFLGPECFPVQEAEQNEKLFFEPTEHGGHVGFVSFVRSGEYWHETRVTDFFGKLFRSHRE